MNRIVLLAAAYLCVFSQLIFSADLYRCGNTFQDTPCVGAIKSKIITNIDHASKLKHSAEIIDNDCFQKGEIAKKIMWMREIGKTAKDQTNTATDLLTKQVIAQVYQLKGSSLQVKGMVERDCMQQKEKDLLFAKMMVEAQRLRNDASPAGSVTINNQAQKPIVNKSKSQTSKEDLNFNAACSNYPAQLEAIAVKRKKGGPVGYMEELKQSQLKIETEAKLLSC